MHNFVAEAKFKESKHNFDSFNLQLLLRVSCVNSAPEQPQNLNWEASDPLLVYWTPPTHINGDLDGYRIQYGKVKNSSDSFEEVITFDERYIFEPELELPIKCEALDEKTLYQVRVSAYNLASGLRLYGPHIEKTAALCQYVNPDSKWL